MTLREAITAFLNGGGFATANEIIDGVVASGHSESREVRSELKKGLDAGDFTRMRGESAVFLYAISSDTTRAIAAKRDAVVKKKPTGPSLKERFELLRLEHESVLLAARAVHEKNEFLLTRNRRLLDLLERALPTLANEDQHVVDEKFVAEIKKYVNASKENA